MTLRELIIKCGGNNSLCPIDSLGPIEILEVQNEADYCRFALFNYFSSEKFRKDIEHCKLDFDDNEYHGLESFFLINRNKDGFSISVERKFLAPPYSFN